MKTLFDQSVKYPPASHKNDPITSFKAEDKHKQSGKFQYSVNQVREAIIRYQRTMMRPDFTAKELAAFISEEEQIDYFRLYYVIEKRLSVLEHILIKRTSEERNGCKVWQII